MDYIDKVWNKPFFILGSVRSGTTLLRRMLFNHPDLYIPPETYWMPRAILRFMDCGDSRQSWWVTVNAVLDVFEADLGYKNTFKHSTQELRLKLKYLEPEQRSLGRIFSGFYFFHADKNGKSEATRWAEKCPCYTCNLPLIYGAYPKAKFVFLLRDGVDAIASSIEAGIYDNVVDASERWLGAQMFCREFAQKHPEAIKMFRYEDLVLEPEKTVKSVCEFVDLDYIPEMMEMPNIDDLGDVTVLPHYRNVGKPLFTDSIGKGRREMAPMRLSALAGLINEALVEQGYEPIANGGKRTDTLD